MQPAHLKMRVRSRNFLLVAAAMQAFAITGVACDNPDKHPGSEEYLALIETLSDQPTPPVQMLYKLSDMRFSGWPITLNLNFWPIREYDDAKVLVLPSDGLSLVGSEAESDVPYKGALDFVVKPNATGFHYLKIHLNYRQGDTMATHVSVIPIGIGDHGESHAQLSTGEAYGFAGPRLIETLKKRP